MKSCRQQAVQLQLPNWNLKDYNFKEWMFCVYFNLRGTFMGKSPLHNKHWCISAFLFYLELNCLISMSSKSHHGWREKELQGQEYIFILSYANMLVNWQKNWFALLSFKPWMVYFHFFAGILSYTHTHSHHTHLSCCQVTIFASTLPTWTRSP